MTSLWLTRALSRKAYIARDLQEDSVRKIKSSKTLDALAEKPAKNNSGFMNSTLDNVGKEYALCIPTSEVQTLHGPTPLKVRLHDLRQSTYLRK